MARGFLPPSPSSRARRRATAAMGGLAVAALAAVAVLAATQGGVVVPPAAAAAATASAAALPAVRRPAAAGRDGVHPAAAAAVAAAPAGQCAHPRLREAAGGALLAALPNTAYTILSDTVVYSRYARMYDRRVGTPAGPISYDVLGRVWKARGRGAEGGGDKKAADGGGSFAVVIAVPYDAVSRTFTLIREYSPAHGRRVYGFAGGVVEAGEAPAAAAAREMEEETRAVCAGSEGGGGGGSGGGGGAWVDLLGEPEAAAGAPQDKYQREVVHYYLCTAAVPVGAGAGRPRDADEVMDVLSGVTAAALRTVVRGGGMQANFMAAALLALDELGL